MTDTLQRFIFKDTCVRGEVIRLDTTLKVIQKQTNYPSGSEPEGRPDRTRPPTLNTPPTVSAITAPLSASSQVID